MQPATLDPLPDTVTLQAGQALRTALDPATWLEVLEGRAQLVSPPSWFGDTVFTVKSLLAEGDVHRLGTRRLDRAVGADAGAAAGSCAATGTGTGGSACSRSGL